MASSPAPMSASEAPPRTRASRPRTLSLYTLASVLATVFFFWLHHLGNGIPYELAQQRFVDAPPETVPAHQLGLKSPLEYCEMNAAVLAGATGGESGAVANAVMLRTLKSRSSEKNYCPEVSKASGTAGKAAVDLGPALKPRYWWGSKALYATALNWLSVPEYRLFIETVTYGAWLAFAIALALHGLPALAAAVPLMVFGVAYSGIPYFSDASNGPGYLLAVATAAVLALSLRWRATSRLSQPLCYAAGMASGYLWLFDGHNFLAIALIGAVHCLATPKGKARRAVGSMALYAAGFIVILVLGQTTKIVVYDRVDVPLRHTGEFVVRGFLDNSARHFTRVYSPQGRDKHDMDLKTFAALTPELSERQAETVFVLSGAALGAAVAAGMFLAIRRGEFAAIRTCAWFVALMLATGILFALPNDLPYRSARYLFLFPALCLSLLAVVVQIFWGARGSLTAAVGAAILAIWPMGAVADKQTVRGETVEAALNGAVPLARSGFDIYLADLDDDAALIYVKDSCGEIDWGSNFFLHLYPVDVDNLHTEAERLSGRNTIDFGFWDANFASQDGRRCVAARLLPDWDMRIVKTGQFDNRGALWRVRVDFPGSGEAPTADVEQPAEALTPAENPTPPTGDKQAIRSHLYAFDLRRVPVARRATTGGAIEPLGNELLVAMPLGDLALVRYDGAVEWLRESIPMNYSGFQKWDVRNPDSGGEKWTHNRWPFRVADILVKQVAPDSWELFATHHYFAGDCIRFRLSSTKIDRKRGEFFNWFTVSPSWRTVFDAEPCLNFPHHGQQAGGKILTDGSDRLLIVLGDHGRDGWDNEAQGRSPVLPQDPRSHFGKLVSVDIASGHAEILALGLRNPQGLARDRDGRLWVPEHGPRGGDELNVVEEGRNYGWPYVTYGLTYAETVPKGIDAAQAGSHEDYALPAYSWIPSVGVSAVAVNDESRLPLWKNDILVASLIENSLFRVRRVGSRVIYVERIGLEGLWIRDIATMPDGRIALLDDSVSVSFLSLSNAPCNDASDYHPHSVYVLHCSGSSAELHGRASPAANAPAAPDGPGGATSVSGGAALFADHCARCHHVRDRQHNVGPHLVDVVGRRVGAVAGYDFSAAFDTLADIWTKEGLVRFLTAPEEIAPGNRMLNTGISEIQARKIVDFLGREE